MAARSNGVQPVVSKGSLKRPMLPPRPGLCMLSLSIRIDTGFEQHLDDLETRHAWRSVAATFARCPAVCSCATPCVRHIDGDVERRPPIPVPEMRIGAPFEQEPGRIEGTIVERDNQRRHAFRRRPVDVGAGGENRVDTGRAARACRVQQRRQPANRAILRPRLGCDLRWPVERLGPKLDLGAILEQKIDDLGKSRVGGPDQGRLAAPGFPRAGVGPMLE